MKTLTISLLLLRASPCSAFLALALPALAGTWTPDPALPNPDQHQRLYQLGRNWCDANFDPDADLVGEFTKNPPNRKRHESRSSVNYAYGLLLTGDADDRTRAQAILKKVVSLQDTDSSHPTYGAYRWYAEDPPSDLNSAAFNGLILADVLNLDRTQHCLDPDLRSQIEQSVRLAITEVMTRNVDPGYTNIASISIALAAAGAKLLAIPEAGTWAEAKLDAVIALTGDGDFTEYGSPTYTAVSLEGAYMARKFSFSDSFGKKVDAVTDHLWNQVALAYHAPTYQLGGPSCRSYGENMLSYCAALKYLLYLALDGNYPLSGTELDHSWDQAGLFFVADLPIPVRPEFKQTPPPWRAWSVNGPAPAPVRHLFQYREGNFILGTVDVQDEWKQKRHLVAYWRNDAPAPDNMRVGFCLDESNETMSGFDPGHILFHSQQVKDAALVAISAPKEAPVKGELSLVFDDGATMPDAADASPYRIQDGTMTAYLYQVSPSPESVATQPDTGHHTIHVTRPWTTADNIGAVNVISYLIIFRPSDQPAPNVSAITLQAAGTGVTASAQVDNDTLSVSFEK